ncbi:MAG: transposase [Anaerolineae bacterium]
MPGRFPPIPRDTAYIAATVFSSESVCLAIGDHADQLVAGLDFTPIDVVNSHAAWAGIVCLFVTVLQYVDNLPDHRAVDATRTRPDWKYALHLPAGYPGFDGGRLCEFRHQLWQRPAARQILQQVLDRLTGFGLPATRAEDVLNAVCAISRLERLIEALHVVLEAVASTAPEWLLTITRPHWYERYHRLQMTYTLPRTRVEQINLARAIDADAVYLLQALAKIEPMPEVVLEVERMWQEWDRQFSQTTAHLEWRDTQVVCSAGCGTHCSWRGANRAQLRFVS